MPIIIENITREHRPTGINKYRLRINDKIICEYTHDRSYNALAKCLRDAADAVDALDHKEDKSLSLEEVNGLLKCMVDWQEKYHK